MRQWAFEAIGTHWLIEITDPCDAKQFKKLKFEITSRIEEFDADYSRFRDDSWIMQLSQRAGDYILPQDARPLFDLYKELNDLTDGRMTPLIGQTMIDAGYDAEYTLLAKKLSMPPSWDEALDYKYPNITNFKPVVLDVGAAGKGYLVDIVSDIISSSGLENFCVDASGDILVRSSKGAKRRVGLENPFTKNEVIGVAEVSKQSICGSAGNRRSWGEYHHIIDPLELESPKQIAATWVIADTTLLADGLATALYFATPAKLRKKYDFEHCIVYDNKKFDVSPGFGAEMFT